MGRGWRRRPEIGTERRDWERWRRKEGARDTEELLSAPLGDWRDGSKGGAKREGCRGCLRETEERELRI